MNRIFTSIILTVLCVSFLSAQTSIGGVINSYAKVTGIDNTDICNPIITIDDASPFTVGDHLMIIQMKGAQIDTTNTANFGNIINMNSAGLYEKTVILEIMGNDILISTQMVNTYDVNSSVQIVDIPQYVDATVDSDIVPYFWDGEKGGIIAFEVENTLTLNQNITASFAGFRGGVSDDMPSTCNWTSNNDAYFYPDNSAQGDSKGEGIAEFYAGKENGRGPQANGGGGGNDHNSGGGGGSNFGNGGAGGMNLNPSPLQCLGQYPGLGGYSTSSLGNRLLFGGGGGTGDMNNSSGSIGGDGGGIVYIKATTIEGYWKGITANGKLAFVTLADDGAGGGGGGGTIFLDVQNLIFGLIVNAKGGNGGDTNLVGSTGCMGPGGGGGGGIIYTGLPASPDLYTVTTGGIPGVVTNSSSTCNGESLGAMAGTDGLLLPTPTFVEGTTIEHMSIDDNPIDLSICSGETGSFSISTDLVANGYQWQVDDGSGYATTTDGTNYSGSNTDIIDITNLPAGTYTIQCVVNGGCNDMLTSEPATLEVLEAVSVSVDPLDQDICESEMFSLYAEATGTNVTYQWQVNDGSGYIDIVDNATYSGSNMNTLDVQANATMEGYTYQCIVANDCPGTDTSAEAVISFAPLPVPDFTFFISNDTVFVENSSTGFDDYYWDFGTGEPLEPGAVPYYIYEESGTFFITVYTINDCGTTSATYSVTIIQTSIFDTEIEVLDFIISPNPTRDIVNLDMSAETYQEAKIRLYHVTGQLLHTEVTSESQLVLDLSNYASGTYLLEVSIEGKSFTKKVMKQ